MRKRGKKESATVFCCCCCCCFCTLSLSLPRPTLPAWCTTAIGVAEPTVRYYTRDVLTNTGQHLSGQIRLEIDLIQIPLGRVQSEATLAIGATVSHVHTRSNYRDDAVRPQTTGTNTVRGQFQILLLLYLCGAGCNLLTLIKTNVL